MFRNALVSVSDKTGLAEFLAPLAKKGTRIVSTGGTSDHLRSHGIEVVDLKDQTHFPEVMGGRVKTLHPRVHMPILARSNNKDDENLLKAEGLEPFDLVIVNLYPFEKTLMSQAAGTSNSAELVEKIDIGGPTLLRAAAKNFDRIAVVCDPHDYEMILQKGELTLDDRKKLAGKVFAHVSRYDSMISHWFGAFWAEPQATQSSEPQATQVPEEISFGGTKCGDLRYGENPHQKAAWYQFSGMKDKGLQGAEVIQGKALSYNNLLDLEAASQLVAKFSKPAAVAVKHNNPCGVAESSTLEEAVQKMISSDPTSIFGGIIALNKPCTAAVAEKLNALFLECVIAPDFESASLEIFTKKKNLRILKWKEINAATRPIEIRSVAGGFLLQNGDAEMSEPSQWETVGEKANEQVSSDFLFAQKIVTSLKSNAIALVKNGQTLGLGMGQVNRVEAVQHAIDRMHKHFGKQDGVVMASDAFFPFKDSIELASQAGIKWVIQPGGSIKDDEVKNEVKERKMGMVLTGKRHFKH